MDGGDDPYYARFSALRPIDLPQDLPAGGPAAFRAGVLAPTRAAFLLWGASAGAAAVYPMACALGTVALAWALGGLPAGILAALCPLHVPWSSVLGPEVPLAFWLAACAWILPRSGALAGLAFGIAVATRESALLLAPVPVLLLRRRRGALAAFALCAVAGMWAPSPEGRVFSALRQYAAGTNLVRTAGGDYERYLEETGMREPWHRWLEAPRMLLPWDYRFPAFGGIATVGLAAGLIILFRRRAAVPAPRGAAAWAVGYALVLCFAASPRSPTRPLFVAQPRYLLAVLPFLAVLSAWALTHCPRRGFVLGAWAVALLYAGWVGTVQVRAGSGPLRPVAAWLAAHPGERRISAPAQQARMLAYLRGYPPGHVFAEADFPGGLAVLAPAEGAARGWTELARWRYVEEGPRALVRRLLGRPSSPRVTETAVFRVPAT